MTPFTQYSYSCFCCGNSDDIGHQPEFYLKACCCLPLPASPYFPLPPSRFPLPTPAPPTKTFTLLPRGLDTPAVCSISSTAAHFEFLSQFSNEFLPGTRSFFPAPYIVRCTLYVFSLICPSSFLLTDLYPPQPPDRPISPAKSASPRSRPLACCL